jgi:ADP-heptose:LPS heptosyltransferase
MAALDLMISIDSMPAHLAGALGVRTWTLLQAEADWRWMNDREDIPWYPTMRLFRQRSAGDWEGVVRRVLVELRALTKAPPLPA